MNRKYNNNKKLWKININKLKNQANNYSSLKLRIKV